MRASNIKQLLFTLHSSLVTLLLLCGLAADLRAATGTNKQDAGTTDYWTNNAVWTGASYPGFGATENAMLATNMVGSYTNILNTALPNALTTLSLSNVSGTATLIVTNNSLTAGTVNLGTGGRLQVEVAAHPSFTPLTLTTLNLYGLDPKITINNGGRLATTTALIFTNGSDAATGLVVCAAPGAYGSAWDSATAITIGSGGVTGKVLNIDGGGAVGGLVVTHAGADLNIGGLGVNANNSLNLINGARLNMSSVAADTPNLYVGRRDATNAGNRLTVDNAVLEGSQLRIHVGNAPASTGAGPNGGNTMVVTNGGSVNAMIVNVGGYYQGGTITYGSSNNTLMVVGTNSSGVRSSITLGSGSVTWSGIGNAAGAVSNLAVIDNGVVTIGGTLTVGRGAQANFNRLVVTNGGQLVTSGTLFYIGGVTAGASGNSVLLSGAGSLWNMGASTRLEIGSSGCTNNTMTVEGGSVLSNVNALFVGSTSISNELRILNGGRVQVANEVRAPYSGGASNKIIVDNATLLCGELSVGTGSGGGNNILITNGASVTATSLYVGRISTGTGGSNNWITVAGTNSSGARATLSLANGAMGIGSFNEASGFNNRLTIGRGGIMPDVGAVVVGVSGVTTGNVLSIDGGVMTNVSLDVRNNNSLIFSAGTLAMGSATCSNSVAVPVFNVGDGTQAATLLARTGGGTLDFFGGILINSNATVGGIGTFTCRVPGGSALTLTNGATVAPGLGGPGFMTVLKDLVWSGGGIYQCDLTDVAGGEGIGWDSLVVQSSLTLTNASVKQMVIKLDSCGVNTANFSPTQNYAIKIASYVAVTNFVSANFLVDTNAFRPVSAGTWSVGALNGGLYVMYNGGGVAPTPDYTWAVPSNGVWSTNENWTGAVAPTNGGNSAWTLTFGGTTLAYVSTNNLSGPFLLSNLVFSSSLLTGTNLITGSNLVFAGTGGGIQQRDVGTFRVSNSITLNTDLTFSGPGLGAVILHTNISGSGGITKLDAGKLVLQGSNTFTGPVLVNGNGTLEAGNARALGVNSVTVSNGTLLANLGATVPLEFGQPGYGSRAALVTGSGSLWTNNAIFKLGTNSSFNTLNIVNTGRMFNAAAAVIGDRGSNNTAVVKDGGLWSLGGSALTVGNNAATGNVLRIDNGTATNCTPFYVGYGGGQFNSLFVTNGGRLFVGSGGAMIGYTSSNNYAIVEGSNSVGPATLTVAGGALWVGNPNVAVGPAATRGNWMRVGAGGYVESTAAAYGMRLGYQAEAGNYVIITNGGILKTGSGWADSVGYASTNNYVVVSGKNGTQAATWNGGGAAFEVGTGAAGTSGGSGNWVRVENGGVISNHTTVTVGGTAKSENNSLTITNGGLFYSTGAGSIGSASASNNFIVVAGADEGGQQALWYANGQAITIGSGRGTGNVLRIGNGGVLSNAVMFYNNPDAAINNSITVENGGNVYAGLTIGDDVAGSYVTNPTITLPDGSLWAPGSAVWNGGGKGFSVGGYIGGLGNSTGNYACINGRTFTNFGTLMVGYNLYATGNKLVITNGGKLYAGGSTHYVGLAGQGGAADQVKGNELRLYGDSLFDGGGMGFEPGRAGYGTDTTISNTVWIDSSVITNVANVGVAGASSISTVMVLTNGGRVCTTGGGGYLGSGAQGPTTNNSLTIVGGPGVTSRWDNAGGSFALGGSAWGWYNTLTVDGRGTYGSAVLTTMNGGGGAGLGVGNYGNVVVVTNGGCILGVTGQAGISIGTSNRFEITGGSRVEFSAAGSYASVLSGSDSLLLISGSNSVFEGLTPGGNGTHLAVGNAATKDRNTLRVENYGVVTGLNVAVGSSSQGNLLVITNGGKFYSSILDSAIGSSGSRNTGSVSGVDSIWNLGGRTLSVGASGSSNLLWISGGAVVTNVTVLTVGSTAASGSYNTTVVTNGGKLYSWGNSTLGSFAGTVSNTILVTGSTSVWNLAGANLAIGVAGTTNNVLMIDQGGTVDQVGTLTLVSNNAVRLNGGTLSLVGAAVPGPHPTFEVGDGTQPATLKALGGGICLFTNGLRVNAQATLTGVGPVAGGPAPGVVLTNGAILAAGLNGVGTLTLSNTTWYGNATNVVEITSVSGSAGIGYDTVMINTQLTLTANGGKFAVKMDSLSGMANFQTDQNYQLKFMSYGTSTTVNLGDFEVDKTAFLPGGTWWVTNIGNSLYLATTGGAPAATGSYTWDPTKTGQWSLAGNWMDSTGPDAGGNATNVLEFGGSGVQAYTATNNLGTDHLLSNLLLTSTSTGTNILTGEQLKFAGSGSGILLQGSGWTISSNRMNWTEQLTLSGSGSGGMILCSNLVGTGAVAVATYGTYVLAGSNTFDGPVTVNCGGEGQLRVDHAQGLGRTNSVTVSNGTLRVTKAITMGDANQTNWSGVVAGLSSVWTNTSTLTLGAGAGSLGHTLTVDAGRFHATTLALTASNCLVTVTNGGRLFAAVTPSGTNNTVIFSGEGTSLAGNQTISGMNNLLRFERGATASNTTFAVSGISNRFEITKGTLQTAPYANQTMGGNGGVLQITGSQSLLMVNASQLYAGYGGTNSEIRIENGAMVTNGVNGGWGSTFVGGSAGAVPVGNRFVVDNAFNYGSVFYVGHAANADGNQLIVTNGGLAKETSVTVGYGASSVNNQVLVYTNSTLNSGVVMLGGSGLCLNNQMVVNGGNVNGAIELQVGGGLTNFVNSAIITNGGLVTLGAGNGCRIAVGNNSYSNTVQVSSGGMLDGGNYPISIGVGLFTWSNRLVVSTGGAVTNVGTLTVGNPTSANQLFISGGTLSVSNLVCTNVNNTIMFAAGRLNLRGAFVSNTVPLLVGDGAQSAILNLVSGGTRVFTDGLTITNNATLTGVGGITGNTTVYGTNSPGTAGIGVITNSGNVTLAASAVSRFEIGANTTAGSGWDHLAVTGGGTLTLGGTLKPILTGGFSPTNTMSFVIMTNTTASVSGSFANEVSGKVNVYTNDSITSLAGTFNVTVSNSQYVVLTNFKPPLASGTIFKFR